MLQFILAFVLVNILIKAIQQRVVNQQAGADGADGAECGEVFRLTVVS